MPRSRDAGDFSSPSIFITARAGRALPRSGDGVSAYAEVIRDGHADRDAQPPAVRRFLALAVIVALACGGLLALRQATMSTPVPTRPDSRMAIDVSARVVGENRFTAAEMARSLVSICRLEVNSRLVESAFERLDPDTFRFVLTPSLNESDRRQMHGCLEDARLQYLQMEVLRMERLPLAET